MPRQGKSPATIAKEKTNQLMWGQYGNVQYEPLTEWDPKQVTLVEAILTVLETGATVVLRPGSGGRAVGISIWEGDVRHPATWCYDGVELDTWAAAVLARVRVSQAAD
jgi:hypothetical protein